MDIKFKVSGQKLTMITKYNKFVSDAVDFLNLIFDLPREWSGYAVTAEFTQGKNVISRPLNQKNSTYFPGELSEGVCMLSLRGSKSGSVVTTDSVALYIDKYIGSDGSGNSYILPELTNAAEDSDVFLNKEYINEDGVKRTGSFTIDGEIAEQDSLISQIQAALVGKASAGGAKPEQEKVVNITSNGTVEILPDSGYVLSRVEATVNIPTSLPDLGDAEATADDLVLNKQLVDSSGNVITGTLPEVSNGAAVISTTDHEVEGTKGGPTFNVSGVYVNSSTQGVALRSSARLGVHEIPTYLLGTAKREQVAKGVTFTSEAGYLAEGLLDISGSSSSGDNSEFIKMLERSSIEIIIPDGCAAIGDYAFYYHSTLTSVMIADTVTAIGYRSFYQCSALTEVVLPTGLNTVGSQAFYNCKGLESLTFRSTPTSIASNAFGACTGLTTINVPWASGAVANAPWGATSATINYNYKG